MGATITGDTTLVAEFGMWMMLVSRGFEDGREREDSVGI